MQALAAPPSTIASSTTTAGVPPTQTQWLEGLKTLTLGIGAGWIGREALRAYAVGAATWLLLNQPLGVEVEGECEGVERVIIHKAQSLPLEEGPPESKQLQKKKGGLFSSSSSRRLRKGGSSAGGSASSLLRRLRSRGGGSGKSTSTTSSGGSSGSSGSSSALLSPSSPSSQSHRSPQSGAAASYAFVAPPVDWAALSGLGQAYHHHHHKGKGSGKQKQQRRAAPLPPVVLNARARWTRLPSPQQVGGW